MFKTKKLLLTVFKDSNYDEGVVYTFDSYADLAGARIEGEATLLKRTYLNKYDSLYVVPRFRIGKVTTSYIMLEAVTAPLQGYSESTTVLPDLRPQVFPIAPNTTLSKTVAELVDSIGGVNRSYLNNIYEDLLGDYADALKQMGLVETLKRP